MGWETSPGDRESGTPDLVVLDLQQPRLNGIGVISQLRDDLDFEALPIVIMTGHEPERYRASAISAGCDDFYAKAD
jgi:CheY-like chemotaxis protein